MSQNNAAARFINSFLQSNLPLLIIIISLIAGAIALTVTSREEEPQIVVPIADIIITYPGGSAEEVEQMVASRLERMLYQIDGVEYVYSTSKPGMAVVTVRFFVGSDREKSLIKLYNKLYQNMDRVTPGITGWIVKPIEIDDVPIVNVTLYADRYDSAELYRVAEEVAAQLQHIPDSARITIHGGEPRTVHVYLNNEAILAYGLAANDIVRALRSANAQTDSAPLVRQNSDIKISVGPFIKDITEVRNLVVGIYGQRPVYLRDIATITDMPNEVQNYSRFNFGPASATNLQSPNGYAAVTVAVAKKKGCNAVDISAAVKNIMAKLQGSLIPDEVHYQITRDYGQTANDKVNDLVESLAIAIIAVVGLIAFTMGWREALIVAIAIPITYSLSLLINYLCGYTINRVTLFALILSLGLLVDDPIMGVDNIARHLALRREGKLAAITTAMAEVFGPIVMATLAIVVSFLPMFFITGMMGPYMRPMALNVPLTMIISMLVAFVLTPWLCSKFLKTESLNATSEAYDVKNTLIYRLYSLIMTPFLRSRTASWALLGGVLVLLIGSVTLALTGLVPLKMLPFDNKNEFQIVIDLPEGATLEKTSAVTQEIEDLLQTVPEVTDYTSIVGNASPMDFNGLVRHYYFRASPNLADIRINLVHRKTRQASSHDITLRLREPIDRIAQKTGANIKIIEMPPGPPVYATVVAEVYGQPYHTYADLAKAAAIVQEQMKKEGGVVEVDSTLEADQQKIRFQVDRQKASLQGLTVDDIATALNISLAGQLTGIVHDPHEQNELAIIVQLPLVQRSSPEAIAKLSIKNQHGQQVQLGEVATITEMTYDKSIYHKNQRRVVYVTAEMAGRGPAYAILGLESYFAKNPLPAGIEVSWTGEGEWKITLDVFRDLGQAFFIALLAIYVILVYQMNSYLLPVITMLSIPLTLIGIMPGFWLLNLLFSQPVAGIANPVFFTATAMIGMIALGGIVVRNGIILVDFIQHATSRGVPLDGAILESGAIRLRPIFLTAAASMLGAWPITLDPIFSGLAWSLIFGLFTSTTFTLVVIPVVYYLAKHKIAAD